MKISICYWMDFYLQSRVLCHRIALICQTVSCRGRACLLLVFVLPQKAIQSIAQSTHTWQSEWIYFYSGNPCLEAKKVSSPSKQWLFLSKSLEEGASWGHLAQWAQGVGTDASNACPWCTRSQVLWNLFPGWFLNWVCGRLLHLM